MLDGKSECCLLVANFFSASFYVFVLHVDFWKAHEKTISVICRFSYFPFVVSFMCKSSKSCREGSILTEAP